MPVHVEEYFHRIFNTKIASTRVDSIRLRTKQSIYIILISVDRSLS